MKRPAGGHISGTSENFTYFLLMEAAKIALDLAREKSGRSFYHSLHCIVSTAFGLESYLNHLGERSIKFWKSLKRLSPHEKLRVLSIQLGFKPDMSVGPYQSFAQVFSARDRAAHSESITRTFDRPATSEDEEAIQVDQNPLELECTTAKAERLFEDACEIIRDLHKRAGLPYDPLVVPGHTSWVRKWPAPSAGSEPEGT